MIKSKILLRAILLGLLVMLVVQPVYAEYHWNPFDHMTEEDMTDFMLMIAGFFLLDYLVIPLILGFFTYKILQHKYPLESVKLKQVLLWACLNSLILGFLAKQLFHHIPSPISLLLSISFPAAGAAMSYFTQMRQTK